jgi:carbohydrate-binding DOMON domain-containing protein
LSTPSSAEPLSYTDPAGDDFGPGTYTYPTDAVYKRGTFDLRSVEIEDKGAKVEIRVAFSARIEDPWDSKSWEGNGFSLQMVQIYLDTDPKPGSGHEEALPGIHARFGKEDLWDRVVILSPQPRRRLESEVSQKAASLKHRVVIPQTLTVRGKELVATIKKSDLGGAPGPNWGVQVVVQSNEGYPAKDDLLARKVNELAGQHRFGGGNDHECDPHLLDILVSPAKGEAAEIEGQKRALAYTCGPDGQSLKTAVLPMVRR